MSEHLSPESRNLCTRRKVNVVLAKRPTCHAIANTMSDEVVCPKTLMNIKGSLILILRSRVIMIIITALRIMKNFLNPCVTHCQTVDTVRLRRRQGNTRVSIHIAMPINSRCPLVPAWCQRHPLIALTRIIPTEACRMLCTVPIIPLHRSNRTGAPQCRVHSLLVGRDSSLRILMDRTQL